MDSSGWILLGSILCGSGAVIFITAQIMLSRWIRSFNA